MKYYFKGSLSPLPSVNPVSNLYIYELLSFNLSIKCPIILKDFTEKFPLTAFAFFVFAFFVFAVMNPLEVIKLRKKTKCISGGP